MPPKLLSEHLGRKPPVNIFKAYYNSIQNEYTDADFENLKKKETTEQIQKVQNQAARDINQNWRSIPGKGF